MTSKVARPAFQNRGRPMVTGRNASIRRSIVPPAKASGFAYVLLLITVATIGLLSASSLSVGGQITRRDAERELLAIGNEFEQALRSYSGGSGGLGNSAFGVGPRNLQDLIKDPRFPGVRRHLRQIYADPLTGKPEWGLVIEPGGSIVGVYSQADGIPIQRTGFEASKITFENAESYAAWKFGLPYKLQPLTRKIPSRAEAVSKAD